MVGFLFIIFSAFTHSLWNVLLKRSKNKYAFNFYMHFANILFFTAVYPIVFRDYMYFDKGVVITAFIAAIFFSIYHLSVSTAYKYADVSMVYPLTTASPFFIVIWAVIFLKEHLTVMGLTGVILTVLGTAVLNRVRGKWGEFGKGAAFALAGAFFYSFGALMDKKGVGGGNFILYVYSMSLFMTMFIFVYSIRRGEITFNYIKEDRWWVVFAGLVVFGSFISYRYGLNMVNLSYASALRQVSTLFGVIMGILFFKEKFTLYKILGTVIIMAGIVLIKVGM